MTASETPSRPPFVDKKSTQPRSQLIPLFRLPIMREITMSDTPADNTKNLNQLIPTQPLHNFPDPNIPTILLPPHCHLPYRPVLRRLSLRSLSRRISVNKLIKCSCIPALLIASCLLRECVVSKDRRHFDGVMGSPTLQSP